MRMVQLMRIPMWKSSRVKDLELELDHFRRVAQTQFTVEVMNPGEPIAVLQRGTFHDLYVMHKYGNYNRRLRELAGSEWMIGTIRIRIGEDT
jgi:hypothetical protein